MSDFRHELARDIGGAALRSSPAVGGAFWSLNTWVALATLVYVLLQAAYLIWKWRREIRASRAAAGVASKATSS